MSHACGAVRFNSDGLILFYEYNGTVDICHSTLRETLADVSRYWRQHDDSKCTCAVTEPVVIYSDYGGGFSWLGRACRHCRAITDGHDPYADWSATKTAILTNGPPDWAKPHFGG